MESGLVSERLTQRDATQTRRRPSVGGDVVP